ncbi:MAG: LysM peptidoglycan-binding domain-containing protein [Gammaproteobacteria bacterium]|nr:LysM peptidoglycan-binding domain-containing protein [Gammaproteobacteria bacterium]
MPLLAATDNGDALSSIERAILKAAGTEVAEPVEINTEATEAPKATVVISKPEPKPEIKITTAPIVSAPAESSGDVSLDSSFLSIQQAISNAVDEEAGTKENTNSLTAELDKEATETELIQNAIQGFSATINDTNDPYLQSLSSEVDDEGDVVSDKGDDAEPEVDLDLKTTNRLSAPTFTLPILVEETTSQSTITVKPGESLSGIAARLYGDAQAYQRLFDANRDIISDPNKIQPGQKLRLPTR